jgi:hypothetical protein
MHISVLHFSLLLYSKRLSEGIEDILKTTSAHRENDDRVSHPFLPEKRCMTHLQPEKGGLLWCIKNTDTDLWWLQTRPTRIWPDMLEYECMILGMQLCTLVSLF